MARSRNTSGRMRPRPKKVSVRARIEGSFATHNFIVNSSCTMRQLHRKLSTFLPFREALAEETQRQFFWNSFIVDSRSGAADCSFDDLRLEGSECRVTLAASTPALGLLARTSAALAAHDARVTRLFWQRCNGGGTRSFTPSNFKKRRRRGSATTTKKRPKKVVSAQAAPAESAPPPTPSPAPARPPLRQVFLTHSLLPKQTFFVESIVEVRGGERCRKPPLKKKKASKSPKTKRKGREFLVKWQGFQDKTWEPERNLHADLVREFLETH